MPRISKSKTTTDSVSAAVSAPVSAAVSDVSVSVPVSVPVVAVKSKKPKASVSAEADVSTVSASVSVSTVSASTASVSVTASTASTVSVEPAAVAAAVEEDVEASIDAQSVEFMTKLNQFSTMAASLKSEFRTLEKKYARLLKAALKTNSKKKKRAGNRAPSGFVKPTKISDELAKFLEKPTGTEMARTDVTREINKYIRSHNLQDVGNGRKINPDQKLQTLLKLKKTDELTYFNLQKYMSPHFYKAEKAVAASAEVTTSA
jgi:chromatin remodeling complex protein RSC6